MMIALLIVLAIVGLIIGGVLYLRHKIAEKFGGAALKESFGDLGRSVALPMMDDQWLGERRPAPMPTEGAPGIAREMGKPK